MTTPDDETALLDELDALLSGAWASLQAGDTGPVAPAVGRAAEILSALQASAPLSPQARPRLEAIETIRRNLALALAQQHSELAGQLARARGGHSLLRAYGR